MSVEKVQTIQDTLTERGHRYGPFISHANITWEIKSIFHGHDAWLRLDADQKEALDMIAHKVGRIINGDPDYDDSWRDIAGYAMLVADRLTGKVR